MKKYKIRSNIDIILKENVDDYHVLLVGYDNKSFKEKINRLKRWREIRKQKKLFLRKQKLLKVKHRVKKLFVN